MMSSMEMMVIKCKKVMSSISKHKGIILWITLIAVLLLSFVSFFYGDTTSTFDNSVLLAEAIKEGQFFHFYEYSLKHANTYWPAGYDILLYVFFSIWNLPVIILHLLTGFSYLNSPIASIWCKGFSVAMAIFILYIVYKICVLAGCGKKQGMLGAFLTLSSLSFAAPVFIAGQYDTLPLFFMLVGLYFYLKEDSLKFHLFFWLSIPLKIYGLFLLIPLILLKEKRIWAILVKTASSCSLYVLLKLLFINDTVYPFISGSQGEYGFGKLINSSMEYSGYSLCLFLGMYAAICIYCYAKELKREEDKTTYPIYICFLIYACFAALVAINDYWVIFFVPFAVILIMMNADHYKLNVLVETMSSLMYLLYAFINKVYPYSYPGLVKESFIGYFISMPEESIQSYGSIKRFMEHAGMLPYAQLIHTMFVVGIAALIVINRPWAIKAQNGEEKKEPGILWLRVLLIGLCVGLLLFVNLKAGNPVLYTTLYSASRPMEKNILDDTTIITQGLYFEDSYELEELTLFFANDGYVKDNFGSVWIRIIDQDTDSVLLEKRIGASMISPNMPYYLSLSGLRVAADKNYMLSIESVKGMDGSNYSLSPLITNEYVGGGPVVIDGEYQDYNLYMELR